MKITHINMAEVKEGENPFHTAKWEETTEEQEKKILSLLAKVKSVRNGK